MPHHCPACVVTCEDFRLHRRTEGGDCIGDFVWKLGVNSDLVTRGGAIQDLVRPKPGFDSSLLRDLNVSVELHDVKTIYLINHQDCGAYQHFAFESPQAELEQHRRDLEKARRILTDEFPGVKIVLMLAELEGGTDDRYVVRELT